MAPTAWAATVVQDWDTAVYPTGNTDLSYGIGTTNLRLQFAGPFSGGRPTEGTTYSTSGGSHTVGGGGNSIITGKNAGGGAIVTTLTSADSVTAVRFNIFDVDNADQVTVTATNGGAGVAVTLTAVDAGTVVKTFNIAGNVATGNGANSGGNSVAGTLGVDIAGPVDQVVISGITTNGGGTTFLYGVSDLQMVTADPPINACPDPLQRLDWDVVTYTAGSLNQTFTVTDIAPFPDIDFRFTYTGNSADFDTNKPDLVSYANTGSVGGGGNMLDLFHDPDPDTDSQLVTLVIDIFESGTTTPLQLTDLRFSVNDIDSLVSQLDFIDQVTVTGFAGGTSVIPTLEAEGNGAATELHGNTFSFSGNSAIAHGFDDGTDNNPRSSVNFYFDTAVDQILINYDDAAPDDGTFDSSRAVKFSDIVFCPPSSVPVTLNYFASTPSNQGIKVEWQTASQVLHAGFRLLEPVGDDWAEIAGTMVGSTGLSMQPQDYALTLDAAAQLSLPDQLVLESLDADGSRQRFGPFAVGVAYGEQLSANVIPWTEVRKAMAARARIAKSVSDQADIAVSQEGLQRVTHADLIAAGVDLSGADAASIAVSFRDQAVARQVNLANPASGFAAGDSIDFFAEAPGGEDALYLDAYLYRIAIDPARVRAATVVLGAAQSPVISDYRHTERVENQVGYDFAIPSDDPWYDQRLLAFGGPAAANVQLAASAILPGSAQLSLELVGGVDFDEPGADHHVQVSLNGNTIINAFNDGLRVWNLNTPVSSASLIDGNNALDITVPGDTGFLFDIVYLDAYSLSYQRELSAISDRLQFDGEGNGFNLTGFTSPNLVAYAQTDQGDLYALGTQVTADGATYAASIPGAGVEGSGIFSNSFEPDGPGASPIIPAEYWVSTDTQVRRPVVQAVAASTVPSIGPSTNYIILAHPNFINTALQNYASGRAAAGFNAHIINVQDIYAHYSHGLALPSALQQFLADAAVAAPLTHVLLVGGDSFDYRDYTGQGSVSFIPTRYALTNEIIHFTPSDGLLTDLNGDDVPDLAVGRWPVRTTTDLQVMIDKSADFEISGLASARSAVLAAGLLDATAPSFAGQAERVTDLLATPGGGPWSNLDRVYLDDIAQVVAPADVVPTGRQQLIDAINAGRTMTMFSGHGAPTMWTFQGLMTPSIAGSLSNIGQPTLITTFTCWTTYFVNPRVDTLAHQLLNAGDRGAVAVHGAVTLSAYGDNEALATAVIAGMVEDGLTLGQAILAGKQQLAVVGSRYRDVIINWALLGDPTLSINP